MIGADQAKSMVVIGVGNTMRRDDGVGHVAVELLARAGLGTDGCDVSLLALDGEPARLLEAWRGRRRAIVIDAARMSQAAGSIHRVEVGTDPLPGWAVGSSSHSAGLAEAVDLGRTLDRLPGELVLFGIEPAELSFGEGLSDEVRKALPTLVEQILAEVRR